MLSKTELDNICRENDSNQFLPYSARCFFVTILHAENGHFSGEINNLFYEDAIPFDGLDSAILQMDRMMDVLGSPQPSTVLRSFQPRKLATQNTKQIKQEREQRYQYYSNKSFLESRMTHKPQIQIEVLYRQNATWQGTILFTRAKNSSKEYFRSVLELMNLIRTGYQYILLSQKSKIAARQENISMECDDLIENKSEFQ